MTVIIIFTKKKENKLSIFESEKEKKYKGVCMRKIG